MANKKSAKIAVLSLLALLGITACSSSDVMAKPSDYKDQILVSDEDIYNNTRKVIYDAIRDGTLASDVLDKVLYQYAVSTLGRYNAVIPELATSSEEEGINITLKAAAKDAYELGSSKATVRKFIKAHKAYWSVNDDGEHVDDNNQKVTTETYEDSKEIERVKAKWDTIELRIKEAMYKAISGNTSYAYRNKFQEVKYLVDLRTNLKAVENYNKLSENDNFAGLGYGSPKILDPKYDEEDVFEQFLHRANYQTNYGFNQTESENDAATYVEDEIIPTIYRTLLTEQYLFDETYNTLGRAYARQINIISIEDNSEYPKAAEYLMRDFVTNVISAAPADANGNPAASIADSANKVDETSFEMISNIWRGVDLDLYPSTSVTGQIRDRLEAKNAIIAETYQENAQNRTFYKGTEFGDMMENYIKINDNPLLSDTEQENTFTNNGSYTKEVGKEIKTDEIRLKDHVTEGWYVKNGDLSTDSDITSRLFSVSVSNALDTDDSKDRYYLENNVWKYRTDVKENKYVARINGSYFLKVASTESHDGTDPVASADDILFHNNGKWYVVQILEAANSTKMSKNNSKNYAALKGEAVMEKYVNEIAKTLSGNSTYENLAKKHWVSEMDIIYHDTVIYNYFKTNFPELFD